jgi:hypothetical protein
MAVRARKSGFVVGTARTAVVMMLRICEDIEPCISFRSSAFISCTPLVSAVAKACISDKSIEVPNGAFVFAPVVAGMVLKIIVLPKLARLSAVEVFIK